MDYKIGFIGAGKMATAIIKGIIDSGFCKSENIFVSDVSEAALEKMEKDLKISPLATNNEVVKAADIVFCAVKPFVLKDVLNGVKGDFNDKQLLVSIAAGVSIKTIEEFTGKMPVIRVMPNTPAFVKAGMSAVCRGTFATEKHSDLICKIFNSLGIAVKEDEKNIDVITAVSGSGPAYFYYFINEFAKAGVKYGLKKETALVLAAQTALGSAKMALETGVSLEQLIINVTTPGGCTEVGNNILAECKADEIIDKVVKGTMEKAAALGK
ncbi:MAG: pyrroline-5-carboxylate reductase [Candidatus Gastranaerophilales bacterium]|nr:pyrroline-5-carboxylate reductase [Candidatus Gastranaerophilales bacterium]